jgi:pimeloyl-ACP methyl ester carboxylesterase
MKERGMKLRRFRVLAALLPACLSGIGALAWGAAPAAGTYVTIPDTLTAGPDLSVQVDRGLFFVPENRADPKSRVIAVHFLRFPALSATAGRPPVFVLPGGPGYDFDFSDPGTLRDLDRLRRTRDAIYVSQRGYAGAPGFTARLQAKGKPWPLDEPVTFERIAERHRAELGSAFGEWSRRGVDLRGYDILNIVDDVYDLRAALGYDKIVLRGCSFGSQWSFSYIKRWPQTVDRALLSGVEPLDYAYDSPKWLWASMARLAKSAEADPALAGRIPRGGLLAALQGVIERLEKEPVTVAIEDPQSGKPVRITVGADDLREQITSGGFMGDGPDESLGNWPRFILELHSGDYRLLAARSWEQRREASSRDLIGALIDNSLGITAKRDAQLRAEPEARWLGDINDYYHNTRDITPTPKVGDDFRADWPIEVPVLLVNGDLDWSTPVENARHARKFLKRGHLVEVRGGTHCDEEYTMAEERPGEMEKINAFIDVDFAKTTPESYFKTLPDVVEYPAIRFAAPGNGPALYEQWLAGEREAR